MGTSSPIAGSSKLDIQSIHNMGLKTKPSKFAQSWKTVYAILLVLQTFCCALRIYPMMDILGGVVTFLGIALGWYAVFCGMDIQFICYCGMMSIINALFDTVKVVDLVTHGAAGLTGKSVVHDLLSFSMIASPMLMALTAVLSHVLYRDYTNPKDSIFFSKDSDPEVGIDNAFSSA